MKIMIITPYFYPAVGGLENYALHIAAGLQREHGHDIVIVTSAAPGQATTAKHVQGLRVIRLPRMFKLSNTPINPLWRWQLRKIIDNENPDIINAHTPVPYMADMAARAAKRHFFILTYHNDLVKNSFVGNTLAKVFYVLLSRRTLRRSNLIVATSKYYVDNSKYLQKHTQKIRIVSPGVDSTMFHSDVNKTWLKKKYPQKKLALFVGSMKKTYTHKGVDNLIHAIAEVKKSVQNIQLIAVGGGDGIPMYTATARGLQLQGAVDFPGYVTDAELPLYFAGADVCILASTNQSEGYGMVLQEAMACGTKVVGTNVGGIPYTIGKNPLGMLVPPQNSHELATAIIKQLEIEQVHTTGASEYDKESIAYDWKLKASETNAIFCAAHQSYLVVSKEVMNTSHEP
jgi:glycosyltransferase involved in cell wall biosynthesis